MSEDIRTVNLTVSGISIEELEEIFAKDRFSALVEYASMPPGFTAEGIKEAARLLNPPQNQTGSPVVGSIRPFLKSL